MLIKLKKWFNFLNMFVVEYNFDNPLRHYNVNTDPEPGGISYVFFSLCKYAMYLSNDLFIIRDLIHRSFNLKIKVKLMKFIFIPGILATIFAIALILSKIIIFAKKMRVAQPRATFFIANCSRRNHVMTYTWRGAREPRTNRQVSRNNDLSPEALIFMTSRQETDQPPSYTDVMNDMNLVPLTDPPPPYKSQENINVAENRL